MRRRAKKDILVKDFVDDKTKLAMAQVAVGGDLDYVTPRSRTSKEDVLSYLSEARTTLEVKNRFDYATLDSAYFAIYRLIKQLKVQSLGRGLYAATTTGVTYFNTNELSEQELQERGLEAYQNKIKADKIKAPTRGTTGMKLTKHVTIVSTSKRKDAIVEFCATPHTAAQIAEQFGYTSPASSQEMLAGLRKSGRLQVVGKRAGSYLYESSEKIVPAVEMPDIEQIAPAPITPDVTVVPDMAAVAEMPQSERHITDLQQLAMRFLWESDSDNDFGDTPRETLKEFVKWANEQGVK